jgi:hypothetical protein
LLRNGVDRTQRLGELVGVAGAKRRKNLAAEVIHCVVPEG